MLIGFISRLLKYRTTCIPAFSSNGGPKIERTKI